MSEAKADLTKIFYGEDSEPSKEPTDELPEENPEDKVIDEYSEITEADEEQAEQLEESDEEGDTIEVYEIDGKEYTAEQIKALEDGTLMQADYTRKTQALANDRKAFEAEKQSFDEQKAKLDELSADLELLVSEDNEVNWDELKEYDPEKYIDLKEKADKRKSKLAEIKANQPKQDKQSISQEQLQEESNKLFGAHPEWIDRTGSEPKLTQAYQDDMQMVSSYAEKAGYSNEELQQITSAAHWETLLDAARFNKQKSKASAVAKKVIKKPKAVTAKANQSVKKSREEVFYGK